jgi:hypothetical protein
MKRLFTLMVGAALFAGCADRGPVDVSSQRAVIPGFDATAVAGSSGIKVMTYNVYYGTNADPLLSVTDPNQIPFVAVGVRALLDTTNFAEIAKERPHLVGLQEAALYRIQSPGDAALGGTEPATDTLYDFLALLVDSLATHGVQYVVAAADATTDIEIPIYTGVGAIPFDDVRLTDRDAVLVRGDVAWGEAQADKYSAHIPAFGSGVYEGWASVVATFGGRDYRFVSTHLEFQEAKAVNEAQADELVALLEDETRPTILVGDFNSDAYGLLPEKATASYGKMLDAGFVDSWNWPGRHNAGLTCCQADNLLNPFGTYDERVDFIFTRNMPQVKHAGTLVLDRTLVGDRPGDRTVSGLWPSDHAGLVTTFLVPPVAGPASVATE